MIRIVSLTIALALVAGLLYAAWGTLQKIDWLDPQVLLALTVALICWVCAQVIGGLVWWLCLGELVAARVAIGILMVTQIAKYAPGNVGQFLGRAYLAHQRGVPLGKAVASMTVESALVVAASLGAAGLAILMQPPHVPQLAAYLPNIRIVALLLGLITCAIAFVLAAPRLLAQLLPPGHRLRRHLPAPIGLGTLVFAAALQTGTILISGFGLWLIASAVGQPLLPLPTVIAVGAIAIVAGFVTPGAPGGLGVREVVISAGLSPYIGPDTAIAAALIFRAASFLGDIVIFGLGWLMLPASPPAGSIQTSPPMQGRRTDV